MYRVFFKRLIDLVIAAIAVVVLIPLMLPLIVALAVVNRGTPFFFQSRVGRGERVFKVIKLKSMDDAKDENGKLLPDNQRITSLGRFVRSTSLDELPQLINILKGDMSLIGPRPLPPKYLPLYNEEQRLRHTVLPGITGLAQVSGRNSISWKEKFEFDVLYVQSISLANDIKIIIQTIKKVVIREGINQSSDRPMLPFNGSN